MRDDAKVQAVSPGHSREAVLATLVFIDRVEALPRADRDTMFDLMAAWREIDDPDDLAYLRHAMEEVMSQVPITVIPLPPEEPPGRELRAWMLRVGRNIKRSREAAGLDQTQLNEKAGLTPGHVSELEDSEESATHWALEKIAGALGIKVGDLDPYWKGSQDLGGTD